MSTMTVSRGVDMAIESATVLPAGGGFAVLRVAAAPAVEGRSARLRVEHERGVRRLLPIDPFDGRDPRDGSVDFLLPTVLLALPLSLELDDEILPLPALETADGPIVDIAAAYLAQQDDLVDLDERVTGLRAELRTAADRAAAAEDTLAGATDRFENALLLQRREVGVVADQLDDLRLAAARTEASLRDEVDSLQDEITRKDEEIVRLAFDRSEGQTELDAERERARAAGEEQETVLAVARGAAQAAQERLDEVGAERRRLEARLSTLEQARADVEAEHVAALADAEQRLVELEARLADLTTERDDMNARIATLEAERDAIDERRAQYASELAETQSMLAEEREAVNVAYDRIATTIGERDELSERVAALERERAELLERLRERSEASIQQLEEALDAEPDEPGETGETGD